MFERFVREARRVALEANSVAAGLGPRVSRRSTCSSRSRARDHPAGAALREVGLDPQELHDAIQRDFERVLARVGIDASGVDVSANCRRTKPGWGASAKQASSARSRRPSAAATATIGCEHILLGLLRAEHGTVPRLLAAEGIDRDELTGRL